MKLKDFLNEGKVVAYDFIDPTTFEKHFLCKKCFDEELDDDLRAEQVDEIESVEELKKKTKSNKCTMCGKKLY